MPWKMIPKKGGMAKSFQQMESPKETVPNLFCLIVKKKTKKKKRKRKNDL